MPSQYLLAAPVLGIVWPSMAMALWWGAAWAMIGPAQDEQRGADRDGGDPPAAHAPPENQSRSEAWRPRSRR
jgi:hypothetical protein